LRSSAQSGGSGIGKMSKQTEEKTMSVKVTGPAAQALRKVFQLLEDNFNATDGQYLHGYDDDRVAKETGISVNAVKDYRTSAFGKLKAPTELWQAKQDLAALETEYLKMENDFKAKLKDLNQRILQLQRMFD
jgi:hypothetical protein